MDTPMGMPLHEKARRLLGWGWIFGEPNILIRPQTGQTYDVSSEEEDPALVFLEIIPKMQDEGFAVCLVEKNPGGFIVSFQNTPQTPADQNTKGYGPRLLAAALDALQQVRQSQQKEGGEQETPMLRLDQGKIDAARQTMEKQMSTFTALCEEKARIEILMDAVRAKLDEAEFVLTCLEAGQDPEKVALEKAEKYGVGE